MLRKATPCPDPATPCTRALLLPTRAATRGAAFAPAGASSLADEQSCATWSDQTADHDQEGACSALVSTGQFTKGITVTREHLARRDVDLQRPRLGHLLRCRRDVDRARSTCPRPSVWTRCSDPSHGRFVPASSPIPSRSSSGQRLNHRRPGQPAHRRQRDVAERLDSSGRRPAGTSATSVRATKPRSTACGLVLFPERRRRRRQCRGLRSRWHRFPSLGRIGESGQEMATLAVDDEVTDNDGGRTPWTGSSTHRHPGLRCGPREGFLRGEGRIRHRPRPHGQRGDPLRAGDAPRLGLLHRLREERSSTAGGGSVKGLQTRRRRHRGGSLRSLAGRGVDVSEIADLDWGSFVDFEPPMATAGPSSSLRPEELPAVELRVKRTGRCLIPPMSSSASDRAGPAIRPSQPAAPILRTAPRSSSAPAERRGRSEARRHRTRCAGWDPRVMSKRNGSSNSSSSRLAETYHKLILSPALIVWPRSSKSRVALRRKYMTGDAQRRISSVADQMSLWIGSDASNSYWSGFSRNAFMPCAIALRVVSFPPPTAGGRRG